MCREPGARVGEMLGLCEIWPTAYEALCCKVFVRCRPPGVVSDEWVGGSGPSWLPF